MPVPQRRPRRAARGLVLAAAALALLAPFPLPLPDAARPAAASEPCRRPVEGDELPDGAGPYPLIDQLGLLQAWDLAQGEGVTVAVVDSGVDARHPLLGDGAVVRGSEFVNDTTSKRGYRLAHPERQRDCVGHGTAIAGLVAGRRDAEGDRVTGVAPRATVYPVRVDDGLGGTVENASVTMIAAAVDEAVAQGADIINLSFVVVSDYEVLRDAVADAVDAGVLVVAAAGNESLSRVPRYPAAYDGVLAVGAVEADGQPQDSSNAAPWVDLAAYGQTDLLVAAPGGEGYRHEGGTSMAAAQVSGAAALVMSRFPDLTAQQVADRLVASANVVGGADTDETGAGIVDPFAALTHLDGGAEPGDGGDRDGADTEGGEAAEDDRDPAAGRIPLPDPPRDDALLDGTATTALAASGVLLLVVLLFLLGAPGVRRAARRGWRPGPAPDPRDPAEPPPGATPPPADRLSWLTGTRPATTRPTPPAPHRNRTP